MSDEEKTLLSMAFQNLKVVEAIEKQYPDDDGFTNYIGYHLQQAIELSIKHVLETHGIKYPRTHEILDLAVLLPDKYTAIAEDIKSNSRTITHLEADTRYNKNYHASKETISVVSKQAYKFVNDVQKTEQQEQQEIQQQVKDNQKEFHKGFSR